MWRGVSWGLSGILILCGLATLQARVLDVFSLNKKLSLDVYLPSEPCINALDYTEQLNTDAHHFLLVSNCFHSRSFTRSGIVWRFDHVLPSLIYDGTSGDQGQFFQSWLQKPTGRIENIPNRQFDALRLFQQSDERKQIEALHFLCAHTELLAQHPKYAPTSTVIQNYYALVPSCLQNTVHPHEQILPSEFFKGTTGDKLRSLFAQETIGIEEFQELIR